MDRDIKVEVFYGDYDPQNVNLGVTFYFSNYTEALGFIKIVEENSNCNAVIIQSFIFEE